MSKSTDFTSLIKGEESPQDEIIMVDRQRQELVDFMLAVDAKIKLATEQGVNCFIGAYNRIVSDIKEIIHQFESATMSFQEAYKEITSLYVFAEMYLKLEDKKV